MFRRWAGVKSEEGSGSTVAPALSTYNSSRCRFAGVRAGEDEGWKVWGEGTRSSCETPSCDSKSSRERVWWLVGRLCLLALVAAAETAMNVVTCCGTARVVNGENSCQYVCGCVQSERERPSLALVRNTKKCAIDVTCDEGHQYKTVWILDTRSLHHCMSRPQCQPNCRECV